MPQLRKDPILSRWVIITEERGQRPSDFRAQPQPSQPPEHCPFCPGNEARTPPEIIGYREEGTQANHPGWHIRVIPNPAPVLRVEGRLERRGLGMYDMITGIGAHEIIIETPEHDVDLADLVPAQVERVLWAYRDRSLDLSRDPRLRYILIFRNHGASAGSIISHPHSQLIATPIVPKRVEEEIAGSKLYYEHKERCIACDMVRQELVERRRVVAENRNFLSFEPFASRFPFETWIMPKFHSCTFSLVDEEEITDLAYCLKETLMRLRAVLGEQPYNYVIHTAPIPVKDEEVYHWHIEILPKLTRVAGFEWGSGFYINSTCPEDAAQLLREAEIPADPL
ncbi:MAG: galactose-1-phosphate uridylyltransferase [Candidatus Hydrogenedentes bacterium]|nr:galactose-1-phosphate uridylyltransferase [Candidatus Hydrogenedentota bacterium]